MDIIHDSTVKFPRTFIGSWSKSPVPRNAQVTGRHPLTNSNPCHFFVSDGNFVYKPKVPNKIHVDYYQIIEQGNDDKTETKTVRLVGESFGPAVKASIRHLNFYRSKSEGKLTKITFELTNQLKYPAQFRFAVDNASSPFVVVPHEGVVPASGHKFVEVTFAIRAPGVYYSNLFCVILHQKPIRFNLTGVNDDEDDAVEKTRQAMSKIATSKSYMNYCIIDHCNELLAELSQSYISLSFDKPEINGATGCSVNLINRTDKCLNVEWIIDKRHEQRFRIVPASSCVYPRQTGAFQLEYTVKEMCTIEARTFYGRIFPYEGEDVAERIPIPIELHVLVNTFPNATWFPQIRVPRCIIMPVTFPNVATYSTFLLQRSGSFPTAFAFVPPANTCWFSVRPENGIVEGDWRIITVKFQAPVDGRYVENWTLRLNHNRGDDVSIVFEGWVETSRVVIGSENHVRFPCIYPGCQDVVDVPIRNLGQNQLRYRFRKNDHLKIKQSTGNIIGYDTLNLTFTITASYNMPERFVVTLHLYVLLEDKLEYEVVSPTVIVQVKCEYSRLIAVPNFHNFGDILSVHNSTTTFYVYNFGTSLMHFELRSESQDKVDIKILPDEGTLIPKGSVPIQLQISTTDSGLMLSSIKYLVRKNLTSKKLVDNKCQVWSDSGTIYRFQFFASYPTVRIIDIMDNLCGPLFGKENLWEMLDIDGLNLKLEKVKENESIVHYLSVPVAEANKSIMKRISFILKNTSKVDTAVTVKYVQTCNCKPVIEHKSFTRRTLVDKCPHKDLIHFRISEDHITASSIAYVTLSMYYNLVGVNEITYMIVLSNNRQLKLIFTIKGLLSTVGDLSPYSAHYLVDFDPYCIAQHRPETQTCVLYNNTKATCYYRLNTTPINALNEEYKCNVIVCKNPKGHVDPKQFMPLFFMLCPIQMRRYSLKLPLLVESEERVLTVNFEGAPFFRDDVSSCTKPFQVINTRHPNATIVMSRELIVLKYIYENSMCTHIIFVRNVTDDVVMAFSFEYYSLENVLEIVFDPCKGLLRPKEFVPVLLTVRTLSQSCASRVHVCCYLLSYSTLERHMKSKELYHATAISKQQQFDITDMKSSTMPGISIPVEVRPKITHSTININFNIIDYEDRDTIMGLDVQLKQVPLDQLCLSEPEEPCSHGCTHIGCADCLKLTEDRVTLFSAIMESMVCNEINSKKFRFTVQNSRYTGPAYYAQYKFDNFYERNEHLKQCLITRIPSKLLFYVLRGLIEKCIYLVYGVPQLLNNEETLRETARQRQDRYSSKFAFLFDEVGKPKKEM